MCLPVLVTASICTHTHTNWHAFSLVAERVRGMNVHRVANIIDSVAYYRV